MRDQFYKYLPWALGGLIGFFMFRPPAFLTDLGAFAWLIQGMLLAVALLSFVMLMLLANLPEELKLTPLPDSAAPAALSPLITEIEALGFRRVGSPWKVEIAPAATLVGFLHESQPVYATAFATGTVPAKVSFDFVSILDGPQTCGLTTNNNPEGAALPAGNQSFRQVFPGQPAQLLFQRHCEGLTWLGKRGLPARRVSPDSFEPDFREAMANQRRLFLDAPLKGTLVTLWRAASKQVPFVGALAQQRVASQQLSGLQGARPVRA
jgi:hypothetical protein